jgi:glycosyltransferase involved in cell wall biosynthesis
MIEDGRTGLLVDLDDDRALAEKAMVLLADPAAAQALAAHARVAAQRHNWAEVYPQMLAVYRGELAEAAAPNRRDHK